MTTVIPARSIQRTLTAHAAERPESPVITAPRKQPLSYGELWRSIEKNAGALVAGGLVPGERVALVLANGPEWAAAYLTVAALTPCAPLSPTSTRAELEGFFRDLRVKALVTTADQTAAVEAATAAGMRVFVLAASEGDVAGAITFPGLPDGPAPAAWAPPDQVATILLTSGTTSASGKVIPLTHSQLLFFADDIARLLELEPSDRCLNVMPLFHSHGLFVAFLASIQAGASVVCSSGFQFAMDFLNWLVECEATWYTAVPTIQEAILKLAKRKPEAVPKGKIRFIRSASSSLGAELSQAIEDAFGAPVIETYGLTEFLGWIACNRRPPFVRKPGSVGTSAGRDFKILDGAGAECATGAVGEICVRAPELAIQPENVPPLAMPGGWFRTGDLGSIDEDGYLFIRGRVKEIINRGGEKISPVEVDAVLLKHPAVLEAVAFGMPSRTHGEEVAAAVVLARGAEASEELLREFAAKHLSPYKVPRRVVLLDELPRTASGKVSRLKMAEHLGLK